MLLVSHPALPPMCLGGRSCPHSPLVVPVSVLAALDRARYVRQASSPPRALPVFLDRVLHEALHIGMNLLTGASRRSFPPNTLHTLVLRRCDGDGGGSHKRAPHCTHALGRRRVMLAERCEWATRAGSARGRRVHAAGTCTHAPGPRRVMLAERREFGQLATQLLKFGHVR